jgi:hypothetical protein
MSLSFKAAIVYYLLYKTDTFLNLINPVMVIMFKDVQGKRLLNAIGHN